MKKLLLVLGLLVWSISLNAQSFAGSIGTLYFKNGDGRQTSAMASVIYSPPMYDSEVMSFEGSVSYIYGDVKGVRAEVFAYASLIPVETKNENLSIRPFILKGGLSFDGSIATEIDAVTGFGSRIDFKNLYARIGISIRMLEIVGYERIPETQFSIGYLF